MKREAPRLTPHASDEAGPRRRTGKTRTRRLSVIALAALVAVAHLVSDRLTRAQHASPNVNGSIGLTEYGTNNSESNGGTTWFMTWDETNLYVGISGANTFEGAVLYIDRHQPLPNSGTNADGNLTGQLYDSTNFSTLPFRADFVAYFKDESGGLCGGTSYREYRTADGAGGWGGLTTCFGAYASNGTTVREIAIPWSNITGAGRPPAFNFFGYVTSAAGFVYGEMPPENPEGFVGTSATATRFYRVASTENGASTRPFSQNFSQPRAFSVNSTADTSDTTPGDDNCDAGAGVCTLRAALQEANAVQSLDTVSFNIPSGTDPNCDGGTLVCTISPASVLPTITDPVRLDGYTQPGSSTNTLPVGDNAALKIELNGTGAGAGTEGLVITGGMTTVTGLVINRFGGRGIELNDEEGNVITGCFIGTDPGGTIDRGNTQEGIFIQGLVGGSEDNRIGGTLPAERNLISGNNGGGVGGAGGGGNTIQGNYVGTDRNGTADLGNGGSGVQIAGAGSTVGGTTLAARNCISGNGGAGVSIGGGGHFVQGNLIGTDANGTADLGNDGEGVFFNVASGNTIGGAATTTGQPPGNVISGNTQDGVQIGNSSGNTVRGNLIGLNEAGTGALGNGGHGLRILAGTSPDNSVGGAGAGDANVIAFNAGDGVFITDLASVRNPVLSNSIHTNGGLGLDLGTDGPTPNDPLDPDTGPNRLQNFPVLTTVTTSGGATTVNGTLNSTPNSTFRVEFFSNRSCDSSGFGEGQTFLGAKTVTTDATGNAAFTSDPITPAVPTSRVVTSTATVTNDPADAQNVNNTSEFSQCAQEPAAASTFVVNSTSDAPDADTDDGLCLTATPGECTLRAAIQQANANPSADTINFLIPTGTDAGCVVLTGVCTISPASALPVISAPVTIDGYTQPGSLMNTLAVGDNADINIELNGAGAGAGVDGLNISAGNSTVRGLAVYSFTGDGIDLNTNGSNTVSGNFIGTNAVGTSDLGNAGDGARVATASNTVGGSTPAARNLISGNNAEGVDLLGTGATLNTVAGNYIGTDRNGTADVGNGVNGVSVAGPSNVVGGSTATPGQGAGNVIAGNGGSGVRITTNGNSNTVAGNLVGLQSNGATALRNDLEGVLINNGASSNTVGGTASNLRNVISGHTALATSDGVEINGAGTNNNTVAGNYIGTNAAGTVAIPNTDGVKIAAGAQSNTIGGSTATPGVAPGNVISGNTSDGVELTGTNTSSNTVAGNLIGLRNDGTASLSNSTTGVNILGNASNNTVGGSASNLRNVISGNGSGVVVNGASSNTVAGNYIGTDITGALDRGNTADGVFIAGGAQSNSIGGLTATPGTAPGNVISGNNSDGVEITASTTSSNTIRGNLIGLAAGGTALLRNTSNGVLISNAASNTVGGTTATARNVITGGTTANDDGVDLQGADNTVVAGNYVGTDINGTGVNGGASDFGSGGDGVRVSSDSDNCTVGGSTATPGAAPGNVIGGNGSDGVEIAATGSAGNTVAGNLIGTQANGTTAYANGANGVLISAIASTPSNTVGGSTATPGTGLGNVISGNTTNGVQVTTNADSCLIRGNLIGLAAGGASALGNGANGVHFTGTINNTVGGATSDLRNVISGNGTNGVLLNEGETGTNDNNTVAGNYIGTDITGAVDLGNTGDGVHVNGGDVSTVGGSAATTGAAPGNVISGNNSDGVDLTETTGDTNTITIIGNFIGLKANGTEALPNTGDGVGIRANVAVSVVGGTLAGARNVISANGSDGVELASGGHTIQGNFIGTQAGGAAALGNTGHGVHVSAATTTATSVGGAAAGAANTIAFNGGDGVFIPTGINISVRRNSIHSNAGLGIDLGADGVTPNDPLDPDTGGNNLQNFPVITDARTGSTIITGTLNSTASTTFTVEFFSNATPDPTAHGEGQTFLDSISVTTDGSGNATFTHTVATTVALGQVITATATNPAGNTSEFGTTRVVLAATAARLRSFAATHSPDGVTVEWQTSFEVDNLGFNLYREQDGARTLLTPSPVAGSALLVGERTVLAAGNSYQWFDAGANPSALYWLEEIDLSGATETHGPFWPTAAVTRRAKRERRVQPTLLDDLGRGGRTPSSSTSEQHQWPVTLAGSQTSSTVRPPVFFNPPGLRQRDLAARPAVKLHVRRGGWYRVTRAELEAAGLSPSADPARLQLYADAKEQPVRLDEAAWRQGGGAVEFYGEGLDTPSTDTRVYWLVEGERAGRRLNTINVSTGGGFVSLGGGRPPNPPVTFGGGQVVGGGTVIGGGGITTIDPVPNGGAGTATGFPYTIELRERAIYFSSLLNGEKENFFGRVVGATPLRQQLDVRHLDSQDASANTNPPRLEVALQGATAVPHRVAVFLNDEQLGVVEFAGREHKVESFAVPVSKLRDGANEVRLSSGAANDVSLTDYLRLGYRRQYRAEGDALRFTVEGNKAARAVGFTTPDVRVVDITDPLNVSEVAAAVTPMSGAEGQGYAVTVPPVFGNYTRTLYASAGAGASRVEAATVNQPSAWHDSRRADFVIIAHGDFIQQAAALAARRAAEGLATEVVNVEDLYDEFSFGAHSPRAVKDFLAWASSSWARAPRFVLLVGDGTYDPRDYTARGRHDLVPAKLIDTAYMETASDSWFADFDGDGLSEMAVGRLPVRTGEEAALVVSKLVNHEPDAAEGAALMVADRRGADGYDFEAATDAVQSLLPGTFNVTRINRGAQDASTVRAQIVGGINAGPAIVNWMGHGSINVWTGEGLLRGEDAGALSNGGRLPLFVMMTCLNGYYHDPSLESLSEALLKASQGGALAVWTSTGMTEPTGQAAMNRELFGALFGTGSAPLRLGEAMQRARSATSDADVRRTWVLIGDPTTRVR